MALEIPNSLRYPVWRLIGGKDFGINDTEIASKILNTRHVKVASILLKQYVPSISYNCGAFRRVLTSLNFGKAVPDERTRALLGYSFAGHLSELTLNRGIGRNQRSRQGARPLTSLIGGGYSYKEELQLAYTYFLGSVFVRLGITNVGLGCITDSAGHYVPFPAYEVLAQSNPVGHHLLFDRRGMTNGLPEYMTSTYAKHVIAEVNDALEVAQTLVN